MPLPTTESEFDLKQIGQLVTVRGYRDAEGDPDFIVCGVLESFTLLNERLGGSVVFVLRGDIQARVLPEDLARIEIEYILRPKQD